MNCLLNSRKSTLLFKHWSKSNKLNLIFQIPRMIFTGQLDRYKGFYVKLSDECDSKLTTAHEFESSLNGLSFDLLKKTINFFLFIEFLENYFYFFTQVFNVSNS